MYATSLLRPRDYDYNVLYAWPRIRYSLFHQSTIDH